MVWSSYRDLADGITGVPTAAGMAVPVDLSALIQRIVIAPMASSWLSGLVSSIRKSTRGQTSRDALDGHRLV